MIKVRLSEVVRFAPRHTTSEWCCRDLNPRPSPLRYMSLIARLFSNLWLMDRDGCKRDGIRKEPEAVGHHEVGRTK